MTRRCTCREIEAALHTHPRLRTLPLAARMLWQLLAHAVQASAGVLPFSGFARVSLLVSASVTEVETHLPTLLAEGLVLEEAGTLILPIIRDAAEARASRTRAAQENGRKGGRPRKGETPEAAQHRKAQTALMLPMEGGKPETQETQMESSRASDHQIPISEKNPSDAWAGERLKGAVDQMAEAAGFPAGHPYGWAEPKMWLQRLELDTILATLRAVTARAPKPPGSWRYFLKAMDEARNPEPAPSLAALRADLAFREAMREWTANGARGPMPQPGQVAA